MVGIFSNSLTRKKTSDKHACSNMKSIVTGLMDIKTLPKFYQIYPTLLSKFDSKKIFSKKNKNFRLHENSGFIEKLITGGKTRTKKRKTMNKTRKNK